MSARFVPALTVLLSLIITLSAQTVGPNVNMVTGTQVGDGDPFLQRQNEPSLAVSSRNPLHLMAVANDYRLVDVPGLTGIDELGDVWLGIYRSTDGGQTWNSTVLPGCPYNIGPCKADPNSPISGRTAAADGTIRPGPNGMFQMNGIAFDRGKNALGNVFVSTFMDLNNKENGNPFAYLYTAVVDTGTSGVFLDKPWIVNALAPTGSLRVCSVGGTAGVPLQTFPAYNSYLVYAKFTGSSASPSSQILFSRSLDCGKTWSKPTKLSESNAMNQGTSIAVNPLNGEIYVAWRRSATASDTDAIMVTKSADEGKTFVGPARVAVSLPSDTFFDQPKITGSALAFRSKAFPTMAVDGTGRAYIAWAQRSLAPDPYSANARIMVAASTDGLNFPANTRVVADPNPNGGHQFMPSLSFAGGRLMLVYYDSRDSQSYGKFTPRGGGQYQESRVPVGNPAAAFTGTSGRFVVDANALPRLQTIDLRGVQASPGTVPAFDASFRISQYKVGTLPGTNEIRQLQFNPPNFPMFARGTASFIGDYVEVAAPVFLPTNSGGWAYNTDNPQFAVFHATWADNRNVRVPKPPATWANYTPVGSVGGVSLYDPSQPRPVCVPGQEGMRNQDVYSARISPGLVVSALGNEKPLGSIQRAYSVVVQNQTRNTKTFRLTVGSQPTGGSASFAADTLRITLDATVAPRSSISRAIYVKSSVKNATVPVSVIEITAPAGSPVTGGLTGSTTLNPDIANPDIVNPDIVNPDIVNPDIAVAETYNPDIAVPDARVNPDIVNPDIVNPDIVNPDIANPDIVNPDIASGIYNPDIVNPDIVNPDIANPDIANPDIAAGYSDTTWSFRNLGNTSASYLAKLFARDDVKVCEAVCSTTGTCTPGCAKLQLIIHRRFKNNAPGTGSNACVLSYEIQNQTVVSVNSPQFTPLVNISDPSATNPDVRNTTVSLRPGEEAQLTLRSFGQFDPRGAIAPVIVAQAPNTPDARAPLTMAITSFRLPDGLRNRAYGPTPVNTINLQGVFSFSVSTGGLPPGLTLNSATGVISGTPTTNGTFNFTVQVQDKPLNYPSRIATQPLSIRIIDVLVQPPPGTIPLAAAALGQPYSAQVPVQGGLPPLHFVLASGSLPTGLMLNADIGVISGIPNAGGNFTFTVGVSDSSCVTLPCAPQLVTITLSIVVDSTPPVVTPVLTGTLASSGWYTAPVSVTWQVSDPESGVVQTSGCGAVMLTASQTISCTAINGSGLSTTVTRSVQIDTTVPLITPVVSGTPGQNGWYVSNVTVSWTIADPDSGVGANTCVPTSITTETTGSTVTCSVTNGAGLTNSASVTIKIDKTAPTITIATPAQGATYGVGSTFVASYSCADALSQVATCTGPVPTGTTVTTTTTGAQTFSVTAIDRAGNSVTLVRAYNVNTYDFRGFYSPLGAAGTFSGTTNLGQGVPLKWELLSASGTYIVDLKAVKAITSYFTGPRSGTTPCPVVTAGTPFVLYAPTVGATGGSVFRISGTQYTFNWDSSTAAPTGKGCYTVAVQFDDNGPPRATSVELK